MKQRLKPAFAALCALMLLAVSPSQTNAISSTMKLPELGDASSSIFSAQAEHDLGRAWLMSFRNQAPLIDDPLLTDYLEHLIYFLATHSQLKDRRLELVVVDNPTMNAFAVPGGIIGVHNGMFRYAKSEDQFASVLAHELAHISQRHFARSVELQKKAYLPTMAGLLAGLILTATTGSDVGLAVLSSTQAAALQSQINYTRSNEQEADRIGMQNMVNAELDPHAVADMFEQMIQATRYHSSNRIPEFLRTHPVTENRIADARARARNLDSPAARPDLEYQLMRARVALHFEKNPDFAVSRARDAMKDHRLDPTAARYSYALALIRANRLEEAEPHIEYLVNRDPSRITFRVAQAELLIQQKELERADELLSRQLRYNPNNYPLSVTQVEVLRQLGRIREAEAILTEQIQFRPTDPNVWYQLSEIRGLAGDILGVHEARAEYFLLNGAPRQAIRQLSYALQMVRSDITATARMQQRIRDIEDWQEKLEMD
ncbi:MAG: M48 family metalloprotease [Pseudomonadales bacterium]